ncbi:MAG TPA: DUF1552 domain-containing protein [Polyangia bacterium]|nr:DUF1552 domain-containing protein [Polyangia bacterium]
MISYRFKRRAFLAATGGVGLKVMLRNLEASAQTMRSPARLLVTHWPVGIVAGSGDALFKPQSGSVGGSPGLAPFDMAGLGPDMTVLRGVSTSMYNLNGGGSHEQGTVELVTGVNCPGTRANCCEGDDAYAGGASFEQILLNGVPALKAPSGGSGFANSIADSRTDFAEISTQCLSYSLNTQNVNKYNNGGSGTEHIPNKPVLSPLQQFMNLFGNFLPGATGTGGAGPVTTGSGGAIGTGGSAGGRGGSAAADATLKQLAMRKSVLDFAIAELNALNGMIPADAKNKLNIHTQAVMEAESQVAATIDMRYPVTTGTGGASGTGRGGSTGTTGTGGSTGLGGSSGGGSCHVCSSKPAAPPNEVGGADPNNNRGTGNDYGNDGGSTDDSPLHKRVGTAHLEVLKAAFICDLIRVGTFQWSPGTNHVSFKGMYPGSTTSIYQHHPLSHRIGTSSTTSGATPDDLQPDAHFLFNVQSWYFQAHAANFATWKTAVDGCGNSLLDYTAVPFVTEVQATGHERNNMAAMIIGGKQLGFTHDVYKTGSFSINQYWATIAQAFGYSSTVAPFNATAIPGLWTKPPGT